MSKNIWRTAAITSMTLVWATVAAAQHDHEHGEADISILSSLDGGGVLLLDYPVDKRTTIRVTPSALPGVFSSTSPGFVPGQGNGIDEFELAVPTEVEIELVRADDNVSFVFDATTLSTPGDSIVLGQHSCQLDVDAICAGGDNAGAVCNPLNPVACTGGGTCSGTCEPDNSQVHQHGEYFLNLDTGNDRTFGEGSVTLRIREGSGTSVGYGESEELTLKVSNGYLPGLETDPNDPTAAAAADKCRKAVAKQTRTLVSKQHQLLTKCLDAVFAAEDLGKSGAAAAKVCDPVMPTCSGGANSGNACANDAGCPGGLCSGNTKSLAALSLGLVEKAVSKLDKVCDKDTAGSFTPFSASNLRTHLGMASCRTQELVGAAYFNSIEEMVEAGSTCNESSKTCAAGPNTGAACEPTRCDGGANGGQACTLETDCPGGACAAADDCDTEAVEVALLAAFSCLEMSQLAEE